MIFTSPQFALFLIIVFITYWYLKKHSHRKILLLFASYIFYGWNVPWFCFLIFFSTVRNDKRFSLNMISAISNQGLVRFMIYEKNMNARVLIKFLRWLIKDANRTVFLILDNLRVHHAKLVKAWLERHEDEIEVFYLPSFTRRNQP